MYLQLSQNENYSRIDFRFRNRFSVCRIKIYLSLKKNKKFHHISGFSIRVLGSTTQS